MCRTRVLNVGDNIFAPSVDFQSGLTTFREYVILRIDAISAEVRHEADIVQNGEDFERRVAGGEVTTHGERFVNYFSRPPEVIMEEFQRELRHFVQRINNSMNQSD